MNEEFFNKLPFVSFSEINMLPECRAIYFALSSSGEVLYIGATLNVRARLKSHNRITQLSEMGCDRIFWLENPMDTLLSKEYDLIKKFHPVLNNASETCTVCGHKNNYVIKKFVVCRKCGHREPRTQQKG